MRLQSDVRKPTQTVGFALRRQRSYVRIVSGPPVIYGNTPGLVSGLCRVCRGRDPPAPDRRSAVDEALTDRVVDLAPMLDGVDVTVDRSEVRPHRHDGNMAPSGCAPPGNVAGPLVIAATVLLDGLEAKCL